MAGFFNDLARQALDAPQPLRRVTAGPRREVENEPAEESLELVVTSAGGTRAEPRAENPSVPVQPMMMPAAGETASARSDVVVAETRLAPSPSAMPVHSRGDERAAHRDSRRLPPGGESSIRPMIPARPADDAPEIANAARPAHAVPESTASVTPATPLRPTSLPALRAVAASDRRARSPLVSADAVPDVHIHIGRIELTAPAATAKPAKRKPDSGKTPMSLDEYLQHRRGKTP